MKKAKQAPKLKRKSISKVKVILTIVLTVIMLALIMAFFFLTLYSPTPPQPPTDPSTSMDILDPSGNPGDTVTTAAGPDTSAGNRLPHMYNILVIGRDAVSMSTDTIILVTVDIDHKTINMLQIPRDTYINTASSSKKINACYALGYNSAKHSGKNDGDAATAGIKNLESAVSHLLGVPVDYYVMMDTDGFKALVDIFGGVTVDVPFAMNYDDPDQNLHIHLSAGVQKLNGDTAEQLIRFRKGNGGTDTLTEGDIGRLQVQKIFLTALIQQMLRPSPSELIGMAQAALKYVNTNMGIADITYFIEKCVSFHTSDMVMNTLPGEGVYVDGVSYYTAHEQETLDMVNQYNNVLKTPVTPDNTDIIQLASGANAGGDSQSVQEIASNPPNILH